MVSKIFVRSTTAEGPAPGGGRALSTGRRAAGASSASARQTVGAQSDRAEHLLSVAQHVDVGDRVPAIGRHHRDVDQHPPPVVERAVR
jgi:hypothetical protein